MVAKPPVVNRHGLVNTSQGFGRPYLAIVLHIASGQLAGADSWFDNPAASTRVNYMVGWSGEIHEYYDPASNVRGYQHGIVQGRTSQRFNALHRQAAFANPNTWAVGIEHEDFQQGDVSRQFREHPAMFEASTSLSAWLCERFGIPADTDHFMAHAEIDAINRTTCPMPAAGREEMIARYVARVREKFGQQEDDMNEEQVLALLSSNKAWKALKAAPIDFVDPDNKVIKAGEKANLDLVLHRLKDNIGGAEPAGDHTHPLPDHTHGGVEP